MNRAALTPRPHQASALAAARKGMSRDRPICVQIATGGGKTLVACSLAVEALAKGQVVYFAAPAWFLLRQAVEGMPAAHGDHRTLRRAELCARLFRLGGSESDLPLPELPERHRGGAVVFTTTNTLRERVQQNHLPQPALVLIDEAHHGEHAKTGDRIYKWAKAAEASVVQFTATPRKQARGEVINEGGSFPELVEAGVLAEPMLVDCRPQLDWHVVLDTMNDVAARSLAALANDDRYSRYIVTQIATNNWEKSILFACNVEHAEQLQKELKAEGITALLIHSGCGRDDRARALQAFRKAQHGQKTILINVTMAMQGLDVPDIRSVLLARPTASETLFMQMVGRGSRVDANSGKTSFRIVDFTPNSTNHGDRLCTATRYFGAETGANQATRSNTRPRPLARDYSFSHKGTPMWMPKDARSELQGLCYLDCQSFGIEFEITTPHGPPASPDAAWHRTAEAILAAARSAVGEKRVAKRPIASYQGIAGSKKTSVWNVEWDATVGWELTTPILRNHEGYTEVALVLEKVRALVEKRGSGLVVDRAGTSAHVHFGWGAADLASTLRLVQLARLFEPALATLVAPSRTVHFDAQTSTYDVMRPNPYSVPLCARFTDEALRSARSIEELVQRMRTLSGEERGRSLRYTALNLYGFLQHGETLEVRTHSGTLDAAKILLWVSLWQQLIWAAEHTRTRIPAAPDRDVIAPDGDIVDLATSWLPRAQAVGQAQSALVSRLAARRAEVAGRCLNESSLRSWHGAMRPWAAAR